MRKLKPRELLRLSAQPPDTSALERSVNTLVEMGALTGSSEEAELTLLGHLMLTLPLDIYLCRLVVYGALFGCIADAIIIASALSTQDPFTLPTHLVIKEQKDYAQAVKRSYLTRLHFDNGHFSEPLMLRNMFVQWMNDFSSYKQRAQQNRRGYVQDNARASFTKFSQQFSREYAVVPKRCVHLCMNVLDTATRFKKFVHRESHLGDCIDKLMKILSPFYYEECQPQMIFDTPPRILKALLLGSFAPNLMVGTTKVREDNVGGIRGGGGVMNTKENLMHEMLMKNLDPRRSVQIVLELPRDVHERETMKEDLQETLAEVMCCNPRDLIIHLDPDWKRMYVEFKEVEEWEEQIRARGGVQGTARGEKVGDEIFSKETGKFKKLCGLVPEPSEDAKELKRLPLEAQLLDMFGAGRFKFQARLCDASFTYEDRYEQNKSWEIIPLGHPDYGVPPPAPEAGPGSSVSKKRKQRGAGASGDGGAEGDDRNGDAAVGEETGTSEETASEDDPDEVEKLEQLQLAWVEKFYADLPDLRTHAIRMKQERRQGLADSYNATAAQNESWDDESFGGKEGKDGGKDGKDGKGKGKDGKGKGKGKSGKGGYGGYGFMGEDGYEIVLQLYRPQNPLDICWDVYSWNSDFGVVPNCALRGSQLSMN